VRTHSFLATLALAIAVATPAHAQTIKKVGSNVHKTLQKAGNDVKEVGGEVGSATHKTLKKAGRDAKAQVKRSTGAKPIGGDVGKTARSVSHTSKKTGRSAKKSVKKTSSAAHDSLTKAGKSAKEAVKPPPSF
jgi:hypothetical protein